jgi:hypothetical protein
MEMIKEYVSDIANQTGIKLSRLSLIDGSRLGCLGVHLLAMSTKEQRVDALVYQTDLDNLEKGSNCDALEVRIRNALSRLIRTT